MEFEWDEQKRRKNLATHNVDFRDAVRVFQDSYRLWGYDAEHSELEDRWWTIGLVRDTILFVVTTEREDRVRLVSARKATANERKTYDESRAR